MRKLINIGCKVNQYEGFSLLNQLSGLENLIIVNTCCVTNEAEVKSLKKFRQAVKKYPGHIIVASGCLCQLKPEKFTNAQVLIDNVVRNRLIDKTFPEIKKSRYLLKIEDGCNRSCTFCIVSRLRRDVISKPLIQIKDEINQAISKGFKEIVLVGANIGLYDRGLAWLIQELSRIPNLPRIRLSSIEPGFITGNLINQLKKIPFCRHFHIPIQSADNRVLKAMKRQYDRFYLEKIIESITKNFSDPAIGADLIVGFPEEGEKEFLNTYNFIKENPFTHLHIFPYSPRPLTEASRLGDPIPAEEKHNRFLELKNLIDKKNFEFRKGLLNKELKVIIDRHKDNPSGLSDNYIRVTIKNCKIRDTLLNIKVTRVEQNQTLGIISNRSDDD